MSTFLMKILSVLMSIITSIAMLFAPITECIDSSNFEKAASFDKVEYENQLVPQLDDDGNWTFTTAEI